MTTEKSFTDSKTISKIWYAPESKIMTIKYVTGATYDYDGVPLSVWNEALDAESIGSFVNNNIKGIFDYKKVN